MSYSAYSHAPANRRLEPADSRPRAPFTWPWLDPARMFRASAAILSPARFLTRLIWPLAILAALGAIFNWYDLLAHIDRVLGTLSFWQKLLIGLLVTNLLSKLALGTVMGYFRADPREFGMRLLLGVLPKFYVDRAPIRELDLRTQRTCYATQLLTKLALFAVGIFVWNMLRRSGTGAADMFLALGISGLVSFLFVANPLLPLDGCKWVSAWLGRPKLRRDSFKLTYLLVTRRAVPPGLGQSEASAMVSYTVASILFTAFLIYVVLATLAFALERQLQGTGVLIFCLVLAMLTLFALSMRSWRLRGGNRAARRAGTGGRLGSMPAAVPMIADGRRRLVQESDEYAYGVAAMSEDGNAVDGGARDEGPGHGQGGSESSAGARAPTPNTGRTPPSGGSGPGREPPKKKRGARETPPGKENETDRATAEMLEALLAFDEQVEKSEDLSEFLEELLGDNDTDEAPTAKGDAPGGTKDDTLVLYPELVEDGAVTPVDDLDEQTGGKNQRRRGSIPEAMNTGQRDAAFSEDAGDARGPESAAGRGAAKARAGQNAQLPVLRKPAPLPGSAPANRQSDDLDRVLRMGTHKPRPKNVWLRRFFWAVVIAALIFVALRPYPFEVGGEFIVQPHDRAEVRTRTDGEVTELLKAEGDWVSQGEVMAVLSNWDEQRDIAVREADLARLQAELQSLIDGPTPAEIRVAEQRVTTAQIQVEIAAAELAQQEKLFETDTISRSALEDDRAALRLAEATEAEAVTDLELVTSEATPSEIAAARAEISKHEEGLAFARLKLEQTFVRATVDGQVVSSMSAVPVGTFLPEGGLFAELEDNRTVIAEIEVPETSIEEVEIGAQVELRLWSDTATSVYGTVKRLAPRAEEREFGRVIRVLVEVPNVEGKLSANMTGHGKIDAGIRPVWEVFTRVIVRFLEVELWSWLP